jgi:hypothetical protein
MKHYTHRDFVSLISEVERQGGVYPVIECHAHEIDELVCAAAKKPPMSTGCEEPAIFEVPYDQTAEVDVREPILVPDDAHGAPKGRSKQRRDEEGKLEFKIVTREGAPDGDTFATVTVCANDDLMRLWPRFQDKMRDRDPLTGGH